MPNLPISGLNPVTTPLSGSELLGFVQSGQTREGTVNDILPVIFQNLDFVTVGNGPQYDYQTIHDAVVDGKPNLFVVTSITESVDTIFSGSLNILCNPVSINFNDDINISASAGQDIFNMSCLYNGTVNISYKFTSDNILFDLSAIVASPPGSISGNFIFVNNSDPSVSAKPLVTQESVPHAFELDTIVYLTNGGLNSGFELGFGFVNNFVLVCNQLNDCIGIKIVNGGKINNLLLGSPCSNNTIMCDVTNTTIDNIEVISSSSFPTCCLSNSSCNSANCESSSGLKFNMSSASSGEVSILNNGKNVIPIFTGTTGSIVTNSLIAGTNLTGVSGGINRFIGCSFAGFVHINNSNSYFDFTDTTFQQGLEITNSPGTQLNFCNYGTPGASFTATLDSGALNTTIVGGRSNLSIVDNGINTQIIPIPQIF